MLHKKQAEETHVDSTTKGSGSTGLQKRATTKHLGGTTGPVPVKSIT
jgi:hypothetical protein